MQRKYVVLLKVLRGSAAWWVAAWNLLSEQEKRRRSHRQSKRGLRCHMRDTTERQRGEAWGRDCSGEEVRLLHHEWSSIPNDLELESQML